MWQAILTYAQGKASKSIVAHAEAHLLDGDLYKCMTRLHDLIVEMARP